jgi:LysM repeat protein
MRIPALALVSLTLAACASARNAPTAVAPQPVAETAPVAVAAAEPAVVPPPEAPRDHVATALDLLGAGKQADAKAELEAALAKSPKHATALALMKQIEADPADLLGAESDTYVVQAGDTMSGLAQRFTGDPLMFYALSRYNNLAAPNALAVGRTIKVPRMKAAASAETPATAPPAATEAKAVDPAKAGSIRLQALQLLNTGEAKRAVVLLKQAQALDGTNDAIRRDLERAQRIEAALADG